MNSIKRVLANQETAADKEQFRHWLDEMIE
jgi:hypothetical protein